MKLVKNFVFAVLLVSVLAFNCMAGEIETPGAPKPVQQETTDEKLVIVTSTDTQDPGVETSDYFIYEAMAALLSLY
jgi:Na+-transporting methylmalonyl-CoA/oxaloacetate decarboxylase gamma subunit